MAIILNAITLALWDYSERDGREPNQKLNLALTVTGFAFTLIYVIESMLKIIAFGFVLHSYSYLRDIWNVLDFVIVISG